MTVSLEGGVRKGRLDQDRGFHAFEGSSCWRQTGRLVLWVKPPLGRRHGRPVSNPEMPMRAGNCLPPRGPAGVEEPGSRAEEAHVWGWGWTVLLLAPRVAAPGPWLSTLADRVVRRMFSICEGQSQ